MQRRIAGSKEINIQSKEIRAKHHTQHNVSKIKGLFSFRILYNIKNLYLDLHIVHKKFGSRQNSLFGLTVQNRNINTILNIIRDTKTKRKYVTVV